MKVLIVGATGRVAGYVIQYLKEAGHIVYCGSRHPEKFTEEAQIKPIAFDLHDDKEKMKEAVVDMDAVYFLAGSRGKDLLQTDAFGAVKLMQAAEECGVKRFVMLSSIFALEPDKWAGEESLASITNYNIAKFFADEWLVHHTELDYTIVQPSVLKEEAGIGKIEVNPEHAGTNPISDVAFVLASVLDKTNTYKKVIKMHSGNTLIDEALQGI